MTETPRVPDPDKSPEPERTVDDVAPGAIDSAAPPWQATNSDPTAAGDAPWPAPLEGPTLPAPAVAEGPRPLSRLVTVLAVLVLLPALVFMAWPGSIASRIESIADPERALERIVGRTMDLRDAVTHAAGWRRWLSVALGLEDPEDIEQSLRWYEELAAVSVDPRVDLHLAILEAETGRVGEAKRRLDEWRAREEPFSTFARVLEAAYVESGATARADSLREWLDKGWFEDRLEIALARGSGRDGDARRAEVRLAARGRSVMTRLELLGMTTLIVGVVGFVAGIVVLRRLGRDPSALAAGTALIPPPWPGGRGAAVLLRGGALSLGVLLSFVLLIGGLGAWGVVGDVGTALLDVPTGLIILLPTLVLAHRHLFRPSGLSIVDAVGLRIRHGRGRRIVLATVVVVGIVSAGDVALGIVANALGASGHWTEWFDSDLVFGGSAGVARSLSGAVIAAAVSEEILFRGLLFATLRRRLGWVLAGLVSALAFAALHGYATHGFTSVALSGLVWAWSYERTRSLWPALIGHAFGNFMASTLLLAALR